MAALPQDPTALKQLLQAPPPAGTPYALPIPGSEKPGRSAVYKHWRFQNIPLLERLEPSEQTYHDIFENSVKRFGSRSCLGWRPWNATTKIWEPKYVWLTYNQVAERRKNLGAGIVELHKRVGVTADKYGVGVWSQNRAEWQITGKLLPPPPP